MTSALSYRQRFAATLAHQQTDRPPMDLGSTDLTEIEGNPRVLARLLGLPANLAAEDADEAVLRALDTDIRGVGGILVPANTLSRRVSDVEYINEWGIGYHFSGHHYEISHAPLAGASIADLDKYPWPDPERIAPDTIAALRARAQYLYEKTPYVVCGRHPYFGVLELGCWMCGFDDFLFRMADEPEFVHRFFTIIAAYQKRVDEIYYGALGRYLHFTTSGDDFGTQTGPFLSPAMFHDLITPYLKRRIEHIRTFGSAHFFHHTCGSVHALIPELLSCGVEILNPIQPRVRDMEPDRLKRDFGDRLTFYGGVDTQQLLPHGTPDEVFAATKDLIATLGHDGGYVLSAAHCILGDVPLENVLAMYKAATKAQGP
jgi:uroporphyrinogen decarboxylase